MSNSPISDTDPRHAGGGEALSTLFAHLVIQQANMALMLLGKVVHPETGQVVKDLEAAKLFIDQLEMLEVKTKGNLAKEEASLLQQSLMSTRLAYVEAVESSPSAAAPPPAKPAQPGPASPAPGAPPPMASASAAEEEHRTKFSQKY
jgi:hypothetical protein